MHAYGWINQKKGRKSYSRQPIIFIYIMCVFVVIALIIGISQFVFNLAPERSEFIETERLAEETSQKFSLRLETIREKSAKEIKATRKNS
jgi:hypothetical protein